MSTPDAAASARRAPASHAVPVHKVLNNNVVIAIDESGRERVLMGRGLAFGLKPDDVLDPAKVEKTFILDNGADGERERRLLTDVPYRSSRRPRALWMRPSADSDAISDGASRSP